MSTQITIPSAGDLALNTGEVLTRLPSDALHNRLHHLAETAKEARENLEATELAALVLCALELEHQQKVNHGLPWKKWVKSNCDFSYMTATKRARVLKAARAGAIPNLAPDLIPETAPSLMSQDELRDTGNALANALQGLGGIRQLYLQLEVISLPGGKKDNSAAPGKSAPTEDEDAEHLFVGSLRPLEKLFAKRRHLKLRPDQARELERVLKSYLDDLALIK
jgi:hypothetical protein